MNLARHATVLWRFRMVTAVGLMLGLLLAILGSYQVSLDGGPSLTRRGQETWASTSSVLVTQPGFPEGRVVLPTTPAPAVKADGTVEKVPENELQFADPGRFPNLAQLYSQLATSDQVLGKIAGHPDPARILVTPVPDPDGSSILPIIQIKTNGPTQESALALNRQMMRGLRDLIAKQNADNDVPTNQRVLLPTLNEPSKPALVAGPSRIASILALFLCLVGTIAVTHLLAAIRDRPTGDLKSVPDPWPTTTVRAPEESRRKTSSAWSDGPSVPPEPAPVAQPSDVVDAKRRMQVGRRSVR